MRKVLLLLPFYWSAWDTKSVICSKSHDWCIRAWIHPSPAYVINVLLLQWSNLKSWKAERVCTYRPKISVWTYYRTQDVAHVAGWGWGGNWGNCILSSLSAVFKRVNFYKEAMHLQLDWRNRVRQTGKQPRFCFREGHCWLGHLERSGTQSAGLQEGDPAPGTGLLSRLSQRHCIYGTSLAGPRHDTSIAFCMSPEAGECQSTITLV